MKLAISLVLSCSTVTRSFINSKGISSPIRRQKLYKEYRIKRMEGIKSPSELDVEATVTCPRSLRCRSDTASRKLDESLDLYLLYIYMNIEQVQSKSNSKS